MKILTLFFTYGTSLEDWDKNGSLDRELNVYKKFLEYFDKIYFITYGKNDLKYANIFPENIIILPKKINITNSIYSILIPFIYKKELARSTWLKTNQIMGSWSAVLAKLFFRNKLNVRTGYTESLSYINKNFFSKNIIEIIEFFAYEFSDISVATSQYQKDYIEKKYRPKSITVIPNGIDTEIFKPAGNKVFSNRIKLLFVGRLHPEKNLLNLLEAIKDLKDIEFKIIGQGPMKKEILKLKEKYNLNLEIIPSVSNNKLPEIYNNSDIYIQPSFYEGNPKTILEAMSCGIPVIASDVSGINNIIQHLENGYLCGTDSQSIQKSIIDLKNNKELRERIGQNARKYIIDNYNMEDIINKELDIYKNEIF